MEIARVQKRRTRVDSTEGSSRTTVKRTKLENDGELTPSPTIIQLRRRSDMTSSENSTSPCLDVPPPITVSHTSDHVATSCCSSNSSTEFGNDGLQNLDLQFKNDETEFNCRESEVEVESVSVNVTKNPSESELEEFFSAAEKKIQEQFIQKYNYDIAKDTPMEGRYEWIEMKP